MRDPTVPHHISWDKALDHALAQMDPAQFGNGPLKVEVKFELDDVTINSPGNIGWYKVTLTS
jgi:hypothetical protein